MPRASISLFIKLHSIAGRQQGEQSGTAQQYWQGACGVRGTILCEPERRCQGQGGVGSEEDTAGKLSSYKWQLSPHMGNRPEASWECRRLVASAMEYPKEGWLSRGSLSPQWEMRAASKINTLKVGATLTGSRDVASNRFPGHPKEAEVL